jgi:hypothetical protein
MAHRALKAHTFPGLMAHKALKAHTFLGLLAVIRRQRGQTHPRVNTACGAQADVSGLAGRVEQ